MRCNLNNILNERNGLTGIRGCALVKVNSVTHVIIDQGLEKVIVGAAVVACIVRVGFQELLLILDRLVQIVEDVGERVLVQHLGHTVSCQHLLHHLVQKVVAELSHCYRS